MNGPFKLPNEAFNYAYEAQQEAHRAAILANHGLRFKFLYYEKESILQKWQDFMVNAPITLHNSLFGLFFTVDILISWEMVREVIANGGIFIGEKVPWWATSLICLLINTWAAVTAHFIGKGWSREIQDWERWNLAFVKRQNDLPPHLLDALINKDIRRSRYLAIVSGTVLSIVVVLLVYYRIVFIQLLSEDQALNSLTIVMSVMPLAILAGEFITGDYVWYSIKWVQTLIERNKYRRLFLAYKEQCGATDQLAKQYTQEAQHRDQPVEVVGELELALRRFKERSQRDDNYLDPFEDHQIRFHFRDRHTQKPINKALVFGILPKGIKTGDSLTDEDGVVTLRWDGEIDHLVGIRILDKEYSGPFKSNTTHYIDVFLTPPSSENGHAYPEVVT